VVTALNTTSDTNLVFPLAGGHFSVNSGDLETSVDHAAVGAVHDFTTKGIGGTNTAVVLALGLGETILRPSIWAGVIASILLSHEEFLFDTEPRVVFFGFFHDLIGQVTEIKTGRSNLIMDEGFT
jgi:hypothetical protein